jgi:hypothetical protein
MTNPKVTVKPVRTPTEQLIDNSTQEFTAEDSRGRQITLSKPGALAQYRLAEVVGNSSTNVGYMNMVLPLLYVVSIDGSPVPPPSTKAQLEALITRLDEDGIAAVVKAVYERVSAANPEADRDALKK